MAAGVVGVVHPDGGAHRPAADQIAHRNRRSIGLKPSDVDEARLGGEDLGKTETEKAGPSDLKKVPSARSRAGSFR